MTSEIMQDNRAESVAPTAAPIDFQGLIIAALPSLRQQALALTRNRPDADGTGNWRTRCGRRFG